MGNSPRALITLTIEQIYSLYELYFTCVLFFKEDILFIVCVSNVEVVFFSVCACVCNVRVCVWLPPKSEPLVLLSLLLWFTAFIVWICQRCSPTGTPWKSAPFDWTRVNLKRRGGEPASCLFLFKVRKTTVLEADKPTRTTLPEGFTEGRLSSMFSWKCKEESENWWSEWVGEWASLCVQGDRNFISSAWFNVWMNGCATEGWWFSCLCHTS